MPSCPSSASNLSALSALLALSCSGVALAGCVTSAHNNAPAVAPSASTVATDLKPLTSAATTHPTPGGAGVNLDKSESNAADHPADVAAQLDAAYCYYKLQAYAQAVPAFQKVLRLTPNDVTSQLFLGYSQMAVGTLADAIQTFLKVTEQKDVKPSDLSDAYLEMGNCHWALGHDDQAVEALTRSLAANPHQGRASLGLGTYAAMHAKRDAARADFTAAARDLPPGPQRAQAYACLGRLDEDAKDGAGAMSAYRQALKLDPNNAWAKTALVRLTSAKPR